MAYEKTKSKNDAERGVSNHHRHNEWHMRSISRKVKMKRLVAVLLTLVICVSLCSCGKNITTVEITLENWTDYFDIREVNYIDKNEFGENKNIYFGYGIFLKDEYTDKALNTDKYPLDVVFEVQYVKNYRELIFNSQNGTYTISDYICNITQSGKTETSIVSLIDLRSKTADGSSIKLPNSVFKGYIAAGIFSYGDTTYRKSNYPKPIPIRYFYEDFKIIRVKGTLSYYQ